jgi:hypothetical protein
MPHTTIIVLGVLKMTWTKKWIFKASQKHCALWIIQNIPSSNWVLTTDELQTKLLTDEDTYIASSCLEGETVAARNVGFMKIRLAGY